MGLREPPGRLELNRVRHFDKRGAGVGDGTQAGSYGRNL
jgi:hypothetical protein